MGSLFLHRGQPARLPSSPKKAGPDTESEPQLTMLAGCLTEARTSGARTEVDSHSTHCERCPWKCAAQRLWASHILQTTRACGHLRDPAGRTSGVPTQWGSREGMQGALKTGELIVCEKVFSVGGIFKSPPSHSTLPLLWREAASSGETREDTFAPGSGVPMPSPL